ncbi:MAG TPA: FeoA family protein [Segeticoccus sp.]|uniref:FeoA family protein n=1 Tax=Segeticoccus sp. TaxID=2706531 RepID=UPI002D8115CA|nr:FeoA family protein [Segeticoccus sp.]HET8601974.1 FeoA family protein [Segeticoccus sp.]
MSSTLEASALRHEVRVVGANGDPRVVRRLAELGVRAGCRMVALRRTPGGGRVVSVDGSRIALDRDTLRLLTVEPVGAAG